MRALDSIFPLLHSQLGVSAKRLGEEEHFGEQGWMGCWQVADLSELPLVE